MIWLNLHIDNNVEKEKKHKLDNSTWIKIMLSIQMFLPLIVQTISNFSIDTYLL